MNLQDTETTGIYRVEDADSILSPALIYYQDIIAENMQRIIAIAGGPQRLWPHVKTHKCAQMVRMQMQSGIRRFKCATIAEAEMVAGVGAEEILLAYPLIGPNIVRYIRLAMAYPASTFYALGDDYNQLAALAAACVEAEITLSVLLDVNMGMNRTGVVLDKAQALYERCTALEGIWMKGLHCYDGHHNDPDVQRRGERVQAVNKRIAAMQEALRSKGLQCDVLIMGGTPSFPCHANGTNWYLSPGTAFIHDMGYREKLPDLDIVPGAAVLTRVISHPDQGLFALDLGYKGIASDPEGTRGTIVGLPGATALFQSEEHWVFRVEQGQVPPIGSELYVIPTHICPTSALYPSVLVAQKGRIVDEWTVTARNRKLQY